ncbi:hypothetical protein [Chryseobacterium indoltheticum]|uniref:hypothetical protein n=1 Tax=Chryseobacterium indoltheticum TaxID=254 RepID=UPI003F495645
MNNYNGLLKLGYDINDDQRIEVSYMGYASKSDLNLGIKTGKCGVTPTIGERIEGKVWKPLLKERPVTIITE